MFAPEPTLHVRFPDSFGRRVAIFVDTEEEVDWGQARRRDATSVKAIKALPEAHGFLRGFGLMPTYLIDYPVASTHHSVEVLRGFLELGILLSDQERYAEAVEQLRRATTLQPGVAQAHYRLAQAYRRTGQAALAEKELEVFQQLKGDAP